MIANFDAGWVGARIELGRVTGSLVVVVVAPIRLMIVSWLLRGLPRQLMVIWENRRCSILFHLLCPVARGRR
jgi:hypothetical protein